MDIEKTTYQYMGLSNTVHKEYSDKGSPYAEYYMGPNNTVVSRKMFGLHGLINEAKEPDLKTTGGMLYYHYSGLQTVSEVTDRTETSSNITDTTPLATSLQASPHPTTQPATPVMNMMTNPASST